MEDWALEGCKALNVVRRIDQDLRGRPRYCFYMEGVELYSDLESVSCTVGTSWKM